MKIENETLWKTGDLRRFFKAGLEALRSKACAHVVVKPAPCGLAYTGWSQAGGSAWRKGGTVGVFLPARGVLNLAALALLFEHELAHLHGMEHKDMPERVRTPFYRKARPDWAKGLRVRRS